MSNLELAEEVLKIYAKLQEECLDIAKKHLLQMAYTIVMTPMHLSSVGNGLPVSHRLTLS